MGMLLWWVADYYLIRSSFWPVLLKHGKGLWTKWRIVRWETQIFCLLRHGKEKESMACFCLSAFICIISPTLKNMHGVLPSRVAIPLLVIGNGSLFLTRTVELRARHDPITCPTFGHPWMFIWFWRSILHLLLYQVLLLLRESCYLNMSELAVKLRLKVINICKLPAEISLYSVVFNSQLPEGRRWIEEYF